MQVVAWDEDRRYLVAVGAVHELEPAMIVDVETSSVGPRMKLGSLLAMPAEWKLPPGPEEQRALELAGG